jgi:hypothetical protein
MVETASVETASCPLTDRQIAEAHPIMTAAVYAGGVADAELLLRRAVI